jgi:hypothetical protein
VFTALLQLYWLSFGLIGLATALLLRHCTAAWSAKFIRYLRSTHPALQIVLFFAIGLVTLLPVVVPSYFFEWPLWMLEASYLTWLAVALAILVMHRKLLLGRLHWPRYDRATFVFGVVAAASLLYDYIVSLRIGAPLYGDAPVQLAKVTFFQHAHLSLADPYYSAHGVVDPRYSTNLLDALQATAANLLHATAAQVWKYSYGVYRLLAWMGMFGLLWTYLGKRYRYLAYIVITILPVLWGGYFLFAELPDRVVLVWVVLLLLGLKLWLETGSWPLLVVASLLVASAHALYALVALGYLALTMLVWWVSRSVPLKRMVPPVFCMALLALPVALNMYYPSHANGSSALFHAGIVNGAQLGIRKYGPFTIARLPSLPLLATALACLFAAYLWLARKTQRTSLTLTAYGAMAVGFVILLKPGVLALVGYSVLLYQAKQRAVRVALAVLFCYYGLFIYNPLFWYIAADGLPLWLVARLQELNVLGLVAGVLGLLFVTQWPLKQWGYHRLSYIMLAVVAALLLWYLPRPQVNDYRIASIQGIDNVRANQQREQRLAALTALRPVLQNQVVYSDDANVSINIAAVMTANVQSYNPENESPMADLARRAACAKRLGRMLRLDDLQSAGVTRIITDLPYSRKVAAMAQTRPYLSLVAEAQGYDVYAVATRPIVATTDSVCTVPFGQ